MFLRGPQGSVTSLWPRLPPPILTPSRLHHATLGQLVGVILTVAGGQIRSRVLRGPEELPCASGRWCAPLRVSAREVKQGAGAAVLQPRFAAASLEKPTVTPDGHGVRLPHSEEEVDVSGSSCVWVV